MLRACRIQEIRSEQASLMIETQLQSPVVKNKIVSLQKLFDTVCSEHPTDFGDRKNMLYICPTKRIMQVLHVKAGQSP